MWIRFLQKGAATMGTGHHRGVLHEVVKVQCPSWDHVSALAKMQHLRSAGFISAASGVALALVSTYERF